jgi:membrane fusion protein (multidrug efflux system)
MKKTVFTVLALLLLVGGLAGVKTLQIRALIAASAQAVTPPEAVATSKVEKNTLKPSLEAVGSVVAYQGVTLNAEMAGTIRRIAFDSGATVKTGEVLVELDTSVEKAQLQSAEANLELTRANLESGNSLIASGAIPRTQYIQQIALSKQAEAEVARLTAIIAKKTIRAPFGGRTGIRQVNLGQLVGNGDAIVSLQSLDPVYVDFALPQQRLSQLDVGAAVSVTTDAFPDRKFEGLLSAIHPEVDPTTRSVRLRATLKNPAGLLRPGMFAKAEVAVPGTEEALFVPLTAITYAPYGDSVFVVTPSKEGKGQVVEQKFVRLGAAHGDFVVVQHGLSADDTVVTTGSFKLHNGSAIEVNNDLKPEPSERPSPTDT